MCLVREWAEGCLARMSAPVLSPRMVVGEKRGKPSSASRARSQTASRADSLRATYSASHELIATLFCRQESHEIAVKRSESSPTPKTNPETDRRVSLSAP